MTEQLMLLVLFLLLPMEITAEHPIDKEQIRQEVIQIEIETRAYRQLRSGRGL